MVRAPKVAKLREVRSMQLTISEAHRLPFKWVPNPYCIISLNQVSGYFFAKIQKFLAIFAKITFDILNFRLKLLGPK